MNDRSFTKPKQASLGSAKLSEDTLLLLSDFQPVKPRGFLGLWVRITKGFNPPPRDFDTRSREVVLNVMLLATMTVLFFTVLLLGISYTFLGNEYVLIRIIGTTFALGAVIGLFVLMREGWYRASAHGLIILYFLLASGMMYKWGTDLPIGILLFGLIVILAGILLSARYSLYAAALTAVTLISMQIATDAGHITPNRYWGTEPVLIGDIIAFCFGFGVLAVTSWLFNRQLERSLQRALRAEAGLLRQKTLLEIKVEERTRELQAAQMDKMQELYRFAQLGQFSATLLHDLANHLTTLSLDIEEGLEQQNRSRLLKRAKRRIKYIDDMVQWTNDHLHGKARPAFFNLMHEIDEVIKISQTKAYRTNVNIRLREPLKRTLRCYGDATQFRQLIANLISNAIDAYDALSADEQPREVIVAVQHEQERVHITVEDHGKGIPAADYDKIFEPFFSTKQSSMGIGLYIAKQITKEYFKGDITVESGEGRTVFTIILNCEKR